MFGPELWRNGYWLFRGECVAQHRLVQPFRMQINFHTATASRHSIKDRFPELIAALLDSTLSVSSNRHATNRRTRLQQQPQCVATIRRMVLASQPLDCVVR